MKRKFKTLLIIMENYLFYFFHKKPQFLPCKKTIEMIAEKKMSLVRFGEGELLWMINKNGYFFQKNDDMLSFYLKRIMLGKKQDKIMIALCGPILVRKSLFLVGHARRFYFFWRGTRYKMVYPYLSTDTLYGDAYSTRFYIDFLNKRKKIIDNKILLLRQLWDGRDILFVEGYYSRLGLGNDLFDNALTIRRILCPNVNAFDHYQEILEATVMNYKSNSLIIISLGPTATVLAYDLQSNYNIQALDLGHIDNEYMWYRMGAKKRTKICTKHTAEINNDDELEGTIPISESFKKQVVRVIGNNPYFKQQ